MPARPAHSRALPALLALLGISLAGAHYVSARAPQGGTSAAGRDLAPTPPSDFLNRYCVTCHNSRLKTAGLQLDSLQAERVVDHAEQWEKVVTKLRTGEMPPPGRPRPDEATYRTVASALERDLDAAAAATPQPGRVPVHRLNRGEYTNAVRDLLGLEIDGRALLSSDEAEQEGFDNVASVLSVSPALLENYLSAARTISRRAVGGRALARRMQTLKHSRALAAGARLGDALPFGSQGRARSRRDGPRAGDPDSESGHRPENRTADRR